MHCVITILAATLALFTAGCVSSQRYSPHESWPKAVTAKKLEQFQGVYRNKASDCQTGKPVTNANELFGFLLGRRHEGVATGERVEIRASDDGHQLKLRLLDEHGNQIDSGTLQRNADFDFADGRLILHGPHTGVRSLHSNFGPGVKLHRERLYVTARGDLLASVSENYAMLVMVLIPGASTMEFWMFWPKLAQ